MAVSSFLSEGNVDQESILPLQDVNVDPCLSHTPGVPPGWVRGGAEPEKMSGPSHDGDDSSDGMSVIHGLIGCGALTGYATGVR